jgi:hypothetical protein
MKTSKRKMKGLLEPPRKKGRTKTKKEIPFRGWREVSPAKKTIPRKAVQNSERGNSAAPMARMTKKPRVQSGLRQPEVLK